MNLRDAMLALLVSVGLTALGVAYICQSVYDRPRPSPIVKGVFR